MKKPKKKLSAYNRHVQREMKAGKSMKQAAASWSKKSGKPKAASRAKPRAKARASKSTGGRSTVAKNGFNTNKLFKYMRIGALAAPAAIIATTPGLSIQQKIQRGITWYSGWSFSRNTWSFNELLKGWAPFLGMSAATVGIPKLIAFIRRL